VFDGFPKAAVAGKTYVEGKEWSMFADGV